MIGLRLPVHPRRWRKVPSAFPIMVVTRHLQVSGLRGLAWIWIQDGAPMDPITSLAWLGLSLAPQQRLYRMAADAQSAVAGQGTGMSRASAAAASWKLRCQPRRSQDGN